MAEGILLPDSILGALGRGVAQTLAAVGEVARTDERLGLLSLWVLSERGDEPEYARVLAIRACQTSGSEAVSIRLWLMQSVPDDLGVATTLLSSLEASAYEGRGWRPELAGVLPEFLLR